MKFIKDLLFFELHTTGSDPDNDSVLQLSAVLLDKDNLLEKDHFNSYVRVSYLDGIISQHAKELRVPFETLKKSPKIYDAIKKFRAALGSNFLLATHTLSNLLFLKTAFRKSAVKFDYNSHIIDLWTLGYIYTLNYGLKKMPTFNTFADHFGLKQHSPWDALEKVRLEAEIFRKIIQKV